MSAHYVTDEISAEYLIYEHTFMYLIEGIMRCYDGSKTYTLKSGDYGLARKNRLARYRKEKEDGKLEKVFVFFDEAFLKKFQEKHAVKTKGAADGATFVELQPNDLVPVFIRSLLPYYKGGGIIEPAFADVKREELLLILLKQQPELADMFFDFGKPEKINLEEFMNKNYQFNVSIDRLAYLTGRSLSAFKRDFKEIFNDTPGRWLVKRRLQEAHFLIVQQAERPVDIFLDLGFETLSHFSYAFKKLFGKTPTELAGENKRPY